MTSAPTLDADEALARADRLSAALAERAVEAEALRRMHPDTVRDLGDLDLWRMVVPTSLGGHGLDVETLAQATRILGQGCVAQAWTASFLIMHNWMLIRFPEATRDELFGEGDPWALAPAPLAPTGTLEPADGGFELSGTWEFATGVHHGDWVMVHAVQHRPELATRFALLPIEEVEIHDVWSTSGMKATGSDTVSVAGARVPTHRTADTATVMFGGDRIEGDAMSGLPAPQLLAMIAAAPALGAAEAAVELFRERVATRVLAFTAGDRAIDQPAAQIRLGTVISELDAARAHWNAALAELHSYSGGDGIPLDRRMAIRLTASSTVRAARSIIDTIAAGAGASVYFDGSPFQRIQRDVEVLKGHVIFDWDRTTQLAGKLALGLDPDPGDMV